MTSFPEVQASIVDWHGLDPSKFGNLRLAGRFSTARDAGAWQDGADCFLFDKVVVITVEKEPSKRTLKGSVLLKHLKDVKSIGDPPEALEMHLEVAELPILKLRCEDKKQLEAWMIELSSMANSP